MSVVIVVGAQWGDEGKGKVVDLFTERADVVVRYGGGANAGHTLVIDGKKLVTHLVPSGVCHPGKSCVLGDGMVIDPYTLLDEIAECQDRGLLVRGELLIGLGAHVILPYHKLIDGLREDFGAKQGKAIGTTRRGIGPAYEMKAARKGIRVRDLLKPERLRDLVAANVDDLSPLIEHLGGTAPTKHEVTSWCDDALAAGERLRPHTGEAGRHVSRAIGEGRHVRGLLLGSEVLDHGLDLGLGLGGAGLHGHGGLGGLAVAGLEGLVEDLELVALGRLDLQRALGTVQALELLPVTGDLEDGLDGLGRLRADAQPVLRPVGDDVDVRRVLLGVVLADLLDHLAVALLARVDDDDAVLRHPDLAQALETNLDGHVCGVSLRLVCG